ncbi:MAG: dCTP deaminase [Candidatus Omnitrophica bacterium]|nr:dCTP deaminase [Candidatus Omnitrophota bacterium]
MIKPDSWIKRMSLDHRMIEPFVESQVRQGCISFGPSSYGYDIRIADEFQVFAGFKGTVPEGDCPQVIDPKNFNPRSLTYLKGDVCVIPANSFVLARSLEYFRIPRNILALCFGKSSYARCGIIVNVTPSEPEWEGYLTISISNTAPVPAKLYANEGIAQMVFLESDEICEVSYADKKGKYQKQTAITTSRVEG